MEFYVRKERSQAFDLLIFDRYMTNIISVIYKPAFRVIRTIIFVQSFET